MAGQLPVTIVSTILTRPLDDSISMWNSTCGLIGKVCSVYDLLTSSLTLTFVLVCCRSAAGLWWSVAADKYYLSDAYSDEEAELDGGTLVRQLCKRDGRRPAVFLRLRQETNHSGELTGRAGAEARWSGQ